MNKSVAYAEQNYKPSPKKPLCSPLRSSWASTAERFEAIQAEKVSILAEQAAVSLDEQEADYEQRIEALE